MKNKLILTLLSLTIISCLCCGCAKNVSNKLSNITNTDVTNEEEVLLSHTFECEIDKDALTDEQSECLKNCRNLYEYLDEKYSCADIIVSSIELPDDEHSYTTYSLRGIGEEEYMAILDDEGYMDDYYRALYTTQLEQSLEDFLINHGVVDVSVSLEMSGLTDDSFDASQSIDDFAYSNVVNKNYNITIGVDDDADYVHDLVKALGYTGDYIIIHTNSNSGLTFSV